MIIHRRAAIKQFLFVSAGAALIPSCMLDKSKSAILLKNMSVSGDQEKLLAALAETIIPTTSTPGAKDVSAHLFALKMLDDCYSEEDQQKFIKGMEQFDNAAKKQSGKSFIETTAQERETLLNEMESKRDPKEDAAFFYATTKRLTIQAYTTSQYYLTKVQVYEMIPSRYHGCVPVASLDKKAS